MAKLELLQAGFNTLSRTVVRLDKAFRGLPIFLPGTGVWLKISIIFGKAGILG